MEMEPVKNLESKIGSFKKSLVDVKTSDGEKDLAKREMDKALVSFIKKNHKESREDLIDDLFSRSHRQLVEDYLAEKDTLNNAVFFIIESGNYDAFIKYCKANN